MAYAGGAVDPKFVVIRDSGVNLYQREHTTIFFGSFGKTTNKRIEKT